VEVSHERQRDSRLGDAGACRAISRVSPGRQAEQDFSIPDQRRQPLGYCEARGIEVVAEFVEPGATATDDKRPSFQRMMDEASQKPGTRVCREL